MTKETYDVLTPFANRLSSVSSVGWTRMSRAEVDTINSVAKDAVGYELTKGQKTCPHCVLKLLKALDKAYKEYVPPKPRQRRKKNTENGEEQQTE